MADNTPPVGTPSNKRGLAVSNTHTTVARTGEKAKIDIVGGASSAEKKSLGKKFKESFVKQDIKAVGRDLLENRIVPGILCMLRDTIWDAITMHFGLGGSRGSNNNSGRAGYTNYSTVSSGSSYNYRGSGSNQKSEPVPAKREGPKDWRDICFTNEKVANDVLASMRHYARQYNRPVEIAEYYEACEFTTSAFTDHNWGWGLEQLENVSTYTRMVDGQLMYFLDLPSPIPVD